MAQVGTARRWTVWAARLAVLVAAAGCAREGGPHPEVPNLLPDAGASDPDGAGESPRANDGGAVTSGGQGGPSGGGTGGSGVDVSDDDGESCLDGGIAEADAGACGDDDAGTLR